MCAAAWGNTSLASVSEILKTARELERKGNWEGAASEFRKLQQMEPCPPIAFNLMGDLHHRNGDPETAFQWYQEAVERYARDGLYGNAIGVCRKMQRHFPDRNETHEQLGGLFFSQGLAREAVKHYMNFITRAAERSDSESVLRTAARVREILPDDGAVRERLAEVFVSLSLAEEGIVDLRAALADYRAKELEGDRERVEERIRVLGPIACSDPLSLLNSDPSVGLSGAVDPDLTGEVESFEPIEPLDHSRIEPARPESGKNQGTAAPETRDEEHGFPGIPNDLPVDEIEIIAPGVDDTLLPEMGEGDIPSGDAPGRTEADEDFVPVEEILRQFQNGVEKIIDKGDYQSRYDMGMSYMEMGLYEEALREFESAASSPAIHAACEEMKGAVLLELGRVREAVRVLSELIARAGGEEVGIHFLLGIAYEKLGEKDLALGEYRFVEERDPNFRNVGEKIARIID